MTMKRLFLGTKKDLSIGAICDVTTKKAQAFKHTYNSENKGLAGTREVALSAVVEMLKKFDIEGLTEPADFYVTSSLYKIISEESYKHWIMTGKQKNGGKLNESEYKLWLEFSSLMSELNVFIIFKDLQSANFMGTPKFNQAEVKYNKFYYEWLWKQIYAVYPKGVASEPEFEDDAQEPA